MFCFYIASPQDARNTVSQVVTSYLKTLSLLAISALCILRHKEMIFKSHLQMTFVGYNAQQENVLGLETDILGTEGKGGLNASHPLQ